LVSKLSAVGRGFGLGWDEAVLAVLISWAEGEAAVGDQVMVVLADAADVEQRRRLETARLSSADCTRVPSCLRPTLTRDGGSHMTDSTPAPPPPVPPTPGSSWGAVGKIRNPWGVVGLSFITFGIYFLYWTYQVFREMKDHSGEGVGGVVGLVIGLVIGVVNWFLIPSEIGNIYARAGHEKPVRGVTGFWNLIPLVGTIIWIIKVQGALNERWQSAAAA
jgi:hypothetical protein